MECSGTPNAEVVQVIWRFCPFSSIVKACLNSDFIVTRPHLNKATCRGTPCTLSGGEVIAEKPEELLAAGVVRLEANPNCAKQGVRNVRQGVPHSLLLTNSRDLWYSRPTVRTVTGSRLHDRVAAGTPFYYLPVGQEASAESQLRAEKPDRDNENHQCQDQEDSKDHPRRDGRISGNDKCSYLCHSVFPPPILWVLLAWK
jgi:hypothetical protein